MKENGFTLEKARSRRYITRTITDADNADYIVLLANNPTQAVSLFHSLERASDGIRLHENADKTDYVCFDKICNISTQNVGSLKLLDKSTYLGSSVSSTENDTST